MQVMTSPRQQLNPNPDPKGIIKTINKRLLLSPYSCHRLSLSVPTLGALRHSAPVDSSLVLGNGTHALHGQHLT